MRDNDYWIKYYTNDRLLGHADLQGQVGRTVLQKPIDNRKWQHVIYAPRDLYRSVGLMFTHEFIVHDSGSWLPRVDRTSAHTFIGTAPCRE